VKITDIKQQVKRADRYSIYLDGRYEFSLSEFELLSSGLRIGKELTKQELEELKDTAKLDKAYDRALNLISMRQRSEWEVRTYLKQKGYDSALADTILNKLSIKGYVDDLKFARAWVQNRRLLKATSQRRLVAELRAKRVPDEAAKQALEEDETDELEVLRGLVAKKRTQTRYQDNLKLMQYLARQGYSYDNIKTVLNAPKDS
jgi:regulatory protein